MSALRAAWHRLRASLWTRRHRAEADAELRAELEAHLAMQIDESVRRGMHPDEARRHALARSGGLAAATDAYRDRRGIPMLEQLARDLRWSIRSLGRTCGVALAVTLTLALGVAATTVMFSVVNGILIDPLPFGNSDRLVWTVNHGARPYDGMAPLDMRDWAKLVPSFEAVGSWAPSSATLDDGLSPMHVDIAEVTDNWFTLLGVRPPLGRGFVAGEQGASAPKVVVLSDHVWRANFGGDPGVIGRAIHINGTPYTVVGVAPRGFDFPDHVDLWRPVALVPQMWVSRSARAFRGPIALLKRGATFTTARREALVAAAVMRKNDPAADIGLAFDIQPLHDHLVGNTRTPLLILLGAVGVLLLIACVNVATLLVVRAGTRHAEMGVRLALGAGRRRIVSQLLIESTLLALTGGALGTLLAEAGVRAIVSANVGELPLLVNVRVDVHVLIFSLAVTMLAGFAFGLAPAVRAANTDVLDALRGGARGMSAARGTARLREMLVAVEIALVVPLLVGAMLLTTSFSRLLATDPGFAVDHLVHFDVSLPQCGTVWLPDSTCVAARGTHYSRPDEIRGFTHELLARLRAMPGVEAVSAAMGAPFSSWAKNQGVLAVEGVTRAGQANPVETKYIAPGYFAALGTPILQGRDFAESDYRGNDYCSTVGIVSEGAVKAYFGDVRPIGARVSGYCQHPTEVIGVVGDIKTESLAGPPEPALYRSLDEAPVPYFTVLIRSAGDPATILDAARRTVADLDRNVPVYRMETMHATVEHAAAPARLAARVVSGFALAALLLAVIGIVGLMEHVVRERQRELGIRMALGAEPRQVVALTVRGGIAAVAWGMLPGIALTLGASRLLRALLYGVGATDAPTYALACVSLCVIALAACWLPARRAARIDPTAAIRVE